MIKNLDEIEFKGPILNVDTLAILFSKIASVEVKAHIYSSLRKPDEILGYYLKVNDHYIYYGEINEKPRMIAMMKLILESALNY